MRWINKPPLELDAPTELLAGYFYGPISAARPSVAPSDNLRHRETSAGRETRMRVGANGKLYPYGPGVGTKNLTAPDRGSSG